MEADLSDTIAEIFGAFEDFDFDAHEVDREVAAVEFGEADGVFLGGDDEVGLAFDATVDDVEDFLLSEPVVVGEAFGVDEFAAEFAEAVFETFGLGDTADGGDLFILEEVEVGLLSGEDILEEERVMDAFDDTGVRVEADDLAAQFIGLSVAFGDKNHLGAGEVGGGFAESSAREEVLVAPRLLVIDQNDVGASPPELPILKAVVEQEGVAAELFDGKSPAFDAVFIDEDDDVFEIGGEHERLIAGHFGIEEEAGAVGDDARRGGLASEEDKVGEAAAERGGAGSVAAGEDGDAAAFVLEGAGEFFDDGGFAGSADGEVADGDDLDAEGGVTEEADVIKEPAEFDASFVEFGEEEEEVSDHGGTVAASLFEDDFENKGFRGFNPGLDHFPHGGGSCHSAGGRASGGPARRWGLGVITFVFRVRPRAVRGP